MLILFMCQLALIVYVWVQRDAFLKSMDNVITTIWNQRHVDQKVMDTVQLTVSAIIYILTFIALFRKDMYVLYCIKGLVYIKMVTMYIS